MRLKKTRLMTLLAAGCLLAASPLRAQISSNVTVNVSNVRATMPLMGLGIHTSPYYNDMSHPLVDDRLEEAGVTTLRFGGGGYADAIHWSIMRPQWESGIIGGGMSPWWGESGNFGYVGPGSDFASFVRLLDQVDNGRAVVTVNYGSALKLVGGQSQVPDFGGQPKEAAAWVAYANADASIYGTDSDIMIGVDQQGNDWKTAGYWAKLRASTAGEYQSWAQADGVYNPLNSFLAMNRDAPVGIEYWEIGNETFGTGYYGGGDGYSLNYHAPYDVNRDDHPDLSPARYGQDVVEYATLMKSIDPTIKIGAVLATPPDDYGWSYADLNDNGSKQSNEPYWNDEVLSQPGVAENVDFVMVHWYPWIGENSNGTDLLTQVRTKIPHMINGTTAGQDFGTNAGIRDTLAQHNMPNAEIMVTEFNYFGSLQSGLANAAESIFVADAYASWLELGVTSVQYLEMDGQKFLYGGSNLNRGSAFYGVSMVDRLAKPGDEFVEAISTSNNVRVHAAVQADGSIAVMLLNLHQSGTANINVSLPSVNIADMATRTLLTGGLTLDEQIIGGMSNVFNVSLPPRSIVTYVLGVIPPPTGDFDGDGDVDGRDFLLWQQGGSTTYLGADDLAAWQENFGMVLEITSSLVVPEPTTIGLAVLLTVVGMRHRR